MWDLVPWPGIEPRSPALGAQCLIHWTTREVPESRVLKGNVYPHVCSSIIHDSLRRQKPPKCLLTDEWRNTMWYTHNGILFSFRKEWNSDTCYNMDEPWRHSVQLLSCVRLFATLWIVVRLSMDGPQSLSHVRLFATLWIAARLSMDRPPCPSPTPRVHSNSYPSSQWCHPAISSCRPLLLLLPIHPSIRSFPISQLFAWGGQSIGVSASASVLPMNTQDWSPLGWTGWTSLQSKGLSRVLSNTADQKHQFFSAQLSSQSNSHIHTWPQEKPQPWLDELLLAK